MSQATMEPMRPKDIFLYLIGNRGAILRIAATPWAWMIGALLVLSAGLARNYDHLDLLRQPSWFIGPFAASIFSTLFIFVWIDTGLKLSKHGEKWRNLLGFLTLVWLTAPCAWIYGMPVELITDILTATKWNISFLAVVSLWRVALVIRAITVLTEAPWQRVSLMIILPASLEMMVGSFYKGISLVGIMGGVRLPPADQTLLKATQFTIVASFWIFIGALLAMIVFLSFKKDVAKSSLYRDGSAFLKMSLLAAVACVLTWVGISIPFQPNIQNRYKLQLLFGQLKYDEAIAFASSKERKDFPALHYLAPDPTAYRSSYPLEHLERLPADAPAWLREEWTQNAILAHKSIHALIMPERLGRLRDHHPEIFAALIDHSTTLKAKSDIAPDERSWLFNFEKFSSPDPTKD